MRITYDAEADAVYIYLSERVTPPETRQVDEDICMDFNRHNQLIGIEILDASKRLVLSDLSDLIERIDMRARKKKAQ